jgi:ATP-dependent protease ClpP protease subunit
MKMFKWILAALLLGHTSYGAEKIILSTKNTVTFRDVVDGDSVTKAQVDLMQLIKQRGSANYPLYLVLDSPGGSVEAGLSFIDFAKNINNLHTVSIFAASMAAGIVEALPGKRYITSTGILMFHRASGSFEGYFETGEIESQLKLWKEIVLSMETTNANRLQIPIEEYKTKAMVEWWMYGQSAVKEKGVDEVANLVCTNELIDDEETISTGGIFGRALTFSKCPLFRAPLPKKDL